MLEIVATVLTVYGIETTGFVLTWVQCETVATVLTVYGIETLIMYTPRRGEIFFGCNSTYRLRY